MFRGSLSEPQLFLSVVQLLVVHEGVLSHFSPRSTPLLIDCEALSRLEPSLQRGLEAVPPPLTSGQCLSLSLSLTQLGSAILEAVERNTLSVEPVGFQQLPVVRVTSRPWSVEDPSESRTTPLFVSVKSYTTVCQCAKKKPLSVSVSYTTVKVSVKSYTTVCQCEIIQPCLSV